MVVYNKRLRAESTADITPIHANLINLLEAGMSWLTTRAGLRRLGVVGTDQRDDLEVPEIALREALANALVHRDYEHPELKDQPTRIEVYEDRVVITSFGRISEKVSIEQLNNDPEKVTPVRRNPVLAKIFNLMTYAELNASGISRMHSETERIFLPPPLITAENDIVHVEFTRRPLSTLQAFMTSSIRDDRRIGDVANEHKNVRRVMISSTARDLPEHRKEVMDACLRQGMFPLVMEHIPASDDEAIATSLKMVDQADIYIAGLSLESAAW